MPFTFAFRPNHLQEPTETHWRAFRKKQQSIMWIINERGRKPYGPLTITQPLINVTKRMFVKNETWVCVFEEGGDQLSQHSWVGCLNDDVTKRRGSSAVPCWTRGDNSTVWPPWQMIKSHDHKTPVCVYGSPLKWGTDCIPSVPPKHHSKI